MRCFSSPLSIAAALDLTFPTLNRALLRALKKIAVARGACVICVQADLGGAPAITIYTKSGVREDVLHFDISTVC